MSHTPERTTAQQGRQIEELYRILVDSVRDYAIFVLDTEGRISTWNAGAERIKGYAPEEILGQFYGKFYPEADRNAKIPERQLEVAAREGRYETEGWRIRKDGRRFWAHVVITPLFDGGELIGYGKVTGDMTAERLAQQELAHREHQLAEAQQIARLGNWDFDLESGEVRASRELQRIFEIETSGSLDYDAFVERVHPEDRDKVRELLRELRDEGTPFVEDHRIRRPSGETRWVQSRGEVARDEDGRPIRLLGTTQDITEMKEAESQARRLAGEQAARQEAERTARRMGFLAEASALLGASLEYEDTLETIAWMAVPSFADWCAVDMMDPEGTLRRLAVSHLDEDRLALAQQVHEEYPPDPESSAVHEILRNGEGVLYEEIPQELLEASASDERHLEILRELNPVSGLTVPIRIRDRSLGAITFVYAESDRRYTSDDLAVARELASRAALAIENSQLHSAERDARRRAEAARQRTSRLQAITAGLSEAVTPEAVAEVVMDQGSKALGSASASLVLVRPDRSLEMVRAVGLPDDVKEAYAHFDLAAGLPLAEAIRTEKLVVVEDMEERLERYPEIQGIQEQTGTRAMVAVPLESGNGVIGSLGFGYREDRPFSEEDQQFLMALGRQCAQALERAWLYETEHLAREVAEAANQAKSQFVAMMSHELRTPLSAILGYQELLSEEITGPVNDDQKLQLDRIRASATHLRDLINQILSLSRIEAGKEEVAIEDVDLARLAREAAALVQPDVEAKGLELIMEIPDEEVRVETDSGKVRQVLLNLLSNAIKFTNEGSITVSLEARRERVRLAVEDTGVGIDAKDRERIFDVFTQVDQSMTRRAGGSGLGLAVSRRLARLLDGKLEVQSAPGDGSTFALLLPMARD